MNWFKKRAGQPPAQRGASAAAPADAVSGVGRLLDDRLVVFLPPRLSKEQAIEQLVRRLCERRGLGDVKPYLAKVLEREQQGVLSTTLDTGLAVPHARIDGLKDFMAVLGLLPDGLPDPKQPDIVIRAIFLFLSPNRQELFAQHLHMLRAVSTLFQAAFLDQLLACSSGVEALESIRAQEQRRQSS
ncbi:MAG: PTS sugar transporter subunit IIA [Elusimicrobiota bacterium]